MGIQYYIHKGNNLVKSGDLGLAKIAYGQALNLSDCQKQTDRIRFKLGLISSFDEAVKIYDQIQIARQFTIEEQLLMALTYLYLGQDSKMKLKLAPHVQQIFDEFKTKSKSRFMELVEENQFEMPEMITLLKLIPRTLSL